MWRRRWTVLGRVATLALCLAFVAFFALPCLCMTGEPSSHGHCGRSEGGFNVADRSCCCGGVAPGASETMAKVIPTPTAALVAVVGVLPVSFTIVRSVSAAPAARSSHGPPALLVLRV